MTMSLCMIVKNEEEVLERCLLSCQDLFDEIIIVDTGSTDKTKEIASRYTPHVYDFVWVDDFSKARNFSFSKATSDYIMWLDADDIILAEDLEKLKSLKNKLDGIDVVMLKYNIAFDDNGNPTFSYYRERILKREKQFKWQDRVHEFLVIDGNIVKEDIAITHNKIKKAGKRNLKIYRQMEKDNYPFTARNYYYYGRELYDNHLLKDSKRILQKFLAEEGWIEDKINACYLLYDITKEEEYLIKTLLYDVPRKKTCCLLGILYSSKGEYARACIWYEIALMLPQETNNGFHENIYDEFIPWLNLSVVYYKLGDYKKAKIFHDKCKLYYPKCQVVIDNDKYFKEL